MVQNTAKLALQKAKNAKRRRARNIGRVLGNS